jgi:membrane protein DedA with SNARE-associated domain/membrane-associated phospholipid phosphatase
VTVLALLAGIADRILTFPPWLVLALVFAFPALEASAFVGFVVPGEVAVILGGVAASRGTVPLWAVCVAAVTGAIAGDSIGYVVGRRWGNHLLRGTVGRLPIIRRHLDEHLETARAYVRRRKGAAVFFGRFTAALRVLVPGLAGMSDVHYPTFLAYNVAGGVLWGTAFAVLGYVAGASYKRVERVAGRAGLVLLAILLVGVIGARVARRLMARSSGAGALADRIVGTRPVAWVRRRFPRQVAWSARRLDPKSPNGFWLTFACTAGALAAWAFGGLTQDVVGRDEMALLDPRVTRWVVAHRTEWVTGTMKVVTWLGSNAFIVPVLLLVGATFLLRRRDWRPGAQLAVAVGGAVLLYDVVKAVVGRARPPMSIWIGHYSGWSFPSGHATQAVAFYGTVALVLTRGRSVRARTWAWAVAGIVVIVVAASRVYLGAHWLSDVLGGSALGAAWLCVVMVVALVASSPRSDRHETAGPERDLSQGDGRGEVA